MNSDPIANTAEAFITAEDVGAAMKTLRGKETQKDCARRGGLDRPSWSQYEKGKAFPKPETIERIARGLGIAVADFTEAVIEAWLARMDRTPWAGETEPGVYDFTVSGRIELRPADAQDEA